MKNFKKRGGITRADFGSFTGFKGERRGEGVRKALIESRIVFRAGPELRNMLKNLEYTRG
ncbi:MAG: hypothetical protein IPN08_09470 [Bacteroidales bacterium]|nr:hypothetical protein [Bacteroidales bacterium]